MKKSLIIISLLFSTIIASAQFSVVAKVDVPEDGQEWGVENITNNIGIGYQLNNKVMIGAIKNADSYNLFGRYSLKDNLYLSLESSTELSTDDLEVGVGYSVEVLKNLCIEPTYSLPLKEDANGERSGEFRFGVSYKL